MSKKLIFLIDAEFYRDHVSRDLPAGRLITYDNSGLAIVELEKSDYDELLSDARFYETLVMEPRNPRLSIAAEITRKSLELAADRW